MRAFLIFMALASPAAAQVGPDAGAREALRWKGHEQVADWLSTGLVGVALAAPCLQDRTWRCLENEGLQVGVGLAVSELVKRTVHRNRPNAHDAKSFFSAHTMLACVGTIRRRTWALCPSVGYLRIAADWHWLTDVGTGAAAAALLTTISFGGQ